MNRLPLVLFLLVFCLGIFCPETSSGKEVTLHFFYAENCPGCLAQKPLITELQELFPQLRVQVHDVWQQRDSYELMQVLAEAAGAEVATTPTTALGPHIWFGFNDDIAVEIKAAVKRCLTYGCADLVDGLAVGRSPQQGAGPRTELELGTLPLDPDEFSLPAFTILLGLLDSFNPCAFFVLLFLLSLMVHTHSRQRMLLVGGVFIFFSGLVYFCFMAAWLNLFLVAGQLPWLTSIAGLVALVIAALNIKDHFYLHQGPSLSLAESAKPKLFSRMRNLLKGERLLPTLAGTIVLALVANSYELLCTAGFPMVYTRVLTLRELPAWLYYLYLGLYNLAYIVPLLVIVVLFSVTLGSHKLSEFEGRLLKLISGMMMLMLGLVLLLRPTLLQSLPVVVGLMLAALLGSGLIVFLEKWRGADGTGCRGKSGRN